MRTLFMLVILLTVSCGGNDEQTTLTSSDAGSEAATARELPSGDAMPGVRFEDSSDASDGALSTDGGSGRIDALDVAKSDASKNTPNGDGGGEAEASGPAPVMCQTIDGLSSCANPWPFECHRSSSRECCNLPNCGASDQ